MNKKDLEKFLVQARTKTYAGNNKKSESLLPDSVQYDFAADGYAYRDVYYMGNGIFPGLETVFYKGKPVWSMSYFGDFSKMTEEQADQMLRQALADSAETARLYSVVEKDYGNFTYSCHGSGNIDMLEGSEQIEVDGEGVFYFYYAGGFIGKR